MIQLHRLEGFYWVARAGGYARAARAFPYPITQPAVHQQVSKLEAELGVTLFERVAKDRMQLTPAGRALHEFAAPFFEGLPAALRAVRSGAHGGELVIHAEPLLLRHLVPAWLRRMLRRAPDLRVDLRELREVDVTPLRRGEADLLVCYLPDPPADIETRAVGEVRPFLVLPADHARAGQKRIAPGSLADDPFVAYTEGSLVHDLQMQALAQHGVAPRQLLHASSADAILGIVASGLGYSLVPSLEPDGPRAEGVVARPLTRPRVSFEVVAAWRRDAPRNAMLELALEVMVSGRDSR